MMDLIEGFKIFGPAFLGALAAYLAIREDLAVLRTKTAAHEESLRKLQEWKDRVNERGGH
jgi:hypothetical protein